MGARMGVCSWWASYRIFVGGHHTDSLLVGIVWNLKVENDLDLNFTLDQDWISAVQTLNKKYPRIYSVIGPHSSRFRHA